VRGEPFRVVPAKSSGLKRKPGNKGGGIGCAEICCGDVSSRITDNTPGHRASIVDQNIETAKARMDGFDQATHLGGLGLVSFESNGLHTLRFEFAYDDFGLLGRGNVADGDVCSVACETSSDGGADAARATGDQGDLACEGFPRCRNIGWLHSYTMHALSVVEDRYQLLA
jgi:hypothetical protein